MSRGLFLSLTVVIILPASTHRLTAGDRDQRREAEAIAPAPITILQTSGNTRSSPAVASGKTVGVDVGPTNAVFTFSPSSVTIVAGDTVRWTWKTNGHTVTSGSPCSVDSAYCSPNDTSCSTAGTSATGATYDHIFAQAGTFHYFCRIHCGSGMTGTVTVVEPFIKITSVTRDPNGFTINGETTPSTTITILSAPDPATQFQNPVTATSDALGNFALTDSSATSAVMRFYKATYP